MDLREIGVSGANGIWLAQDRFQWWAIVSMAMNLQVLILVRSGVFPATEYNKILSGYQSGQVVEHSPFNHLTQLTAQEDFIMCLILPVVHLVPLPFTWIS